MIPDTKKDGVNMRQQKNYERLYTHEAQPHVIYIVCNNGCIFFLL